MSTHDRPGEERMEPTADEDALLRSLGAGDRMAAERLVAATYRQVHAALCRLTGDADTAAELTQETYRKAWEALPTFAGRARFSTWLYRIAYTTFLNHLRRPRRVETVEPATLDRVPAATVDPADAAAGADEAARLRRAVLALPDDLRFAVTARFWRDLPVREIARLETVSTVAIHKRLRRALAALRLTLEEVS